MNTLNYDRRNLLALVCCAMQWKETKPHFLQLNTLHLPVFFLQTSELQKLFFPVFYALDILLFHLLMNNYDKQLSRAETKKEKKEIV